MPPIPASLRYTSERAGRVYVICESATPVVAGDSVTGERGDPATVLRDAAAGEEIVALLSGAIDGALAAWEAADGVG